MVHVQWVKWFNFVGLGRQPISCAHSDTEHTPYIHRHTYIRARSQSRTLTKCHLNQNVKTRIPLHTLTHMMALLCGCWKNTESNAVAAATTTIVGRLVGRLANKSNYDSIEKIRTRMKLKATEKENRMHATTPFHHLLLLLVYFNVCVCVCGTTNKCTCVCACSMAWRGGGWKEPFSWLICAQNYVLT